MRKVSVSSSPPPRIFERFSGTLPRVNFPLELALDFPFVLLLVMLLLREYPGRDVSPPLFVLYLALPLELWRSTGAPPLPPPEEEEEQDIGLWRWVGVVVVDEVEVAGYVVLVLW